MAETFSMAPFSPGLRAFTVCMDRAVAVSSQKQQHRSSLGIEAQCVAVRFAAAEGTACCMLRSPGSDFIWLYGAATALTSGFFLATGRARWRRTCIAPAVAYSVSTNVEPIGSRASSRLSAEMRYGRIRC